MSNTHAPHSQRKPPTGIMRSLMRMPIQLYRWRLGWLLGDRFLMMTHIGRKSGKPRYVVLEVVKHDPASNTYLIASGMGEKADWFRNIQQNSNVLIDNGRERFEAAAVRLSLEEAEHQIRDYAQRNPKLFRNLAKILLGMHLSGGDDDYCQFVAAIPLVAIRPAQRTAEPQ